MTGEIRVDNIPAEEEQLNSLLKIHKGLCKFTAWLGFGSKYY